MTTDGQHTIREEQARRLAESMKRQLGAFCPLLEERDVIELMLNADGRLWVDRLGQPMKAVGKLAASTAESFIATVASTLRSAVTRENPILECELPGEPPFDGWFCHVSRRLQRIAWSECSDYASCMMPIAMRAWWRK
jgi:Flp pilus assembly CpaF family ATPase